MASAITALFTFKGNYLLLFPQKGTQSFLTEILKILIERAFVPISLSRTGLVTALMILMFCGLTGKRNFWFIGNYLLLFPQKGIKLFLSEILKILIERVFAPISLSRTGLVTALMILMIWGLIGKRNFWMLLTFMLALQTRRARIRKAPWINSELKKGMRDRDAAKRKAMASNDPRDWAKYKKLRNTINNNIKTSKASYYSNAFSQSKGNSRKTWQTINELTSRRTNNTTVKELKLNGSIISNSSELSNAFNDHFSAIGPRLASEIPPNDNNNDFSYINNTKI